MYYEKEEHTRWGHSNPLCRISVVAVIEDSNEYKAAIKNSIILESQLYKEKEEEEFWRGWEEAGRPKLRCSKPEEKTDKIMNEYNDFKHRDSEIKLMSNYNSEWDFYDKNAIFVIFAEYCPYDDKEINPIHYDCCNQGNIDFNNWLDTHKLDFEWYDSCIGIVSVIKD
jgi:hypothetical protein